jgi:hypothetical protein
MQILTHIKACWKLSCLMADLPSHPAPSNENLQLRMEGTQMGIDA